MAVTIFNLLEGVHSAVKIHTLLRLLKVNEGHAYHVKKLFKLTGDLYDGLQAGRPRSTRTKNVVNVVQAGITRNPQHKQKILSQKTY